IGDVVQVVGGRLIRNLALGFGFGSSVHSTSVHPEIRALWEARSAVLWSKMISRSSGSTKAHSRTANEPANGHARTHCRDPSVARSDPVNDNRHWHDFRRIATHSHRACARRDSRPCTRHAGVPESNARSGFGFAPL